MMTKLSAKTTYWLAFFLSFCSLGYELILTKTVVMVGGEQILLQCLTIGFYIAGLGLGGFLCYRYKNKIDLNSFVSIEALLSLLGGLLPVILLLIFVKIRFLNPEGANMPFYQWQHSGQKYVLLFTIISQIITFIIGTLSGFEIPILLFASDESDQSTFKILGFNYFGALISTLITSYFFLTQFEIITAAIIIAFINLGCIFYLTTLRQIKKTTIYMSWFILLLLGITFFAQDKIHQHYLYARYYGMVGFDQNPQRKIEHYHSIYQDLDLVTYPTSAREEPIYYLFLNSFFQFSSQSEREYHEYIVHAPIQMFTKIPEKVLVLGGGDGLLMREVLKYKKHIKVLDHVELDPYIVKLAQTHPVFTRLNENSLNDPLVNIQYNDAFTFLKANKTKYDAIYIDFPYPTNYDLSKLYSFEFYTYLYKSLNDDGYSVIDHPLTSKDNINGFKYNARLNNVGTNSLHKAGFNQIVPYFSPGSFSESFIAFRKNHKEINLKNYTLNNLQLHNFTEENFRKLIVMPVEHPRANEKYEVNSIFSPKVYKITDFIVE